MSPRHPGRKSATKPKHPSERTRISSKNFKKRPILSSRRSLHCLVKDSSNNGRRSNPTWRNWLTSTLRNMTYRSNRNCKGWWARTLSPPWNNFALYLFVCLTSTQAPKEKQRKPKTRKKGEPPDSQWCLSVGNLMLLPYNWPTARPPHGCTQTSKCVRL